jgi:hypothetical protein
MYHNATPFDAHWINTLGVQRTSDCEVIMSEGKK